MTIPEHNYSKREKLVVDYLRDYDGMKSFLNVGFHNWEQDRKHWWIKICEANNVDWQIMEIHEPNVSDAIVKGCPVDRIFQGDILDTNSYGNYDCLMFWHGPEHCSKQAFLDILPELEKKFKLLIFTMPSGHSPQDEVYGNPYEKHLSEWLVEDWIELGYDTTFLNDNNPNTHITAIKVTS